MFDFIGVAIGILFAILIVSGIIFLIGYAFKKSLLRPPGIKTSKVFFLRFDVHVWDWSSLSFYKTHIKDEKILKVIKSIKNN